MLISQGDNQASDFQDKQDKKFTEHCVRVVEIPYLKERKESNAPDTTGSKHSDSS